MRLQRRTLALQRQFNIRTELDKSLYSRVYNPSITVNDDIVYRVKGIYLNAFQFSSPPSTLTGGSRRFIVYVVIVRKVQRLRERRSTRLMTLSVQIKIRPLIRIVHANLTPTSQRCCIIHATSVTHPTLGIRFWMRIGKTVPPMEDPVATMP